MDGGRSTHDRCDHGGARPGHRAGRHRSERSGRRPGPAGPGTTGRPVLQPGDVLARLQRPGAGAGPGPAHPAAGTGQVPRHLRRQPGRVLHGPGGRAETPAGDGPGAGRRRRALPPGHAQPHLDPHPAADAAARPLLHRRCRAGAGRAGHPDRALGRAGRRRAAPPRRLLPRPGVPRPHPAGGRSGAPVPVHQRAVAEPGRVRPRPRRRAGAVRPGQGAEQRAPVRRDQRHRCRPGRADRHVPAAGGADRGAPGAAVPGHGGGRAQPVPGHPQRRHRGRRGPGRGPAAGAGAGAVPAPVRPGGAAGGGRHHPAARARPAGGASWT